MVALKDLVNRLDSENLTIDAPINEISSIDIRSNYIFNSTIDGIEEADQILIIGSNPRHEAAVLNSRIRGRWLESDDVEIHHIGESFDSTFEINSLGKNANDLEKALNGKLGEKLSNAKKPLIIVGSGVYENDDSIAIDSILKKFINGKENIINSEWNGLNYLQRQASRAGAFDIGFYNSDPKFNQLNQKLFSYLVQMKLNQNQFQKIHLLSMLVIMVILVLH